jgi:hypothetical protein
MRHTVLGLLLTSHCQGVCHSYTRCGVTNCVSFEGQVNTWSRRSFQRQKEEESTEVEI